MPAPPADMTAHMREHPAAMAALDRLAQRLGKGMQAHLLGAAGPDMGMAATDVLVRLPDEGPIVSVIHADGSVDDFEDGGAEFLARAEKMLAEKKAELAEAEVEAQGGRALRQFMKPSPASPAYLSFLQGDATVATFQYPDQDVMVEHLELVIAGEVGVPFEWESVKYHGDEVPESGVTHSVMPQGADDIDGSHRLRAYGDGPPRRRRETRRRRGPRHA